MVKIFVYGSLRKGMRNHSEEMDAYFLQNDTIKNYKMYSLRYYPFIISGNGIIQGEVYDIPEDMFNQIDGMEINAGYKRVTNKTENGIMAIYYIFESMPIHNRRPEIVEGGDWKKWSQQ